MHCDSAPWHVFARGARRLALFQDDQDYLQFIQILMYSLRASGCLLWAFALMGNHYHLVLYGSSDQLTACMRRLGTKYSLYHNKRYGLSGHAFDGPYKAYRQGSFRLALWTIAYVFLNPVKGGLCGAPEDYRWSGYRSYVGLQGSPINIDTDSLMARVDEDPEVAWRRFHEAMRCETRRPPKHVFGRLTMIEVHIQQFGWLLEYAKDHLELLEGEEPLKVAIYWARSAGVVPRAIAHALGMRTTQSVRSIVHDFKERLAAEPALARVLTLP
jgi:putative transposase